MTSKEVVVRKDINYAKMFVRGNENVNRTTEPLRKDRLTNSFLL